MTRLVLLLTLFLVGCGNAQSQNINWPEQLVLNGHSHNDYTRDRPLYDALENGFTSIEIDLFLSKGRLLVAHTKFGLNKKNNLERLYFKPLAELVKSKEGTAYPNKSTELEVMLDLKTGGQAIHDSIMSLVKKYEWLFSYYENGEMHQRAVKLILSGSRDINYCKKQSKRYLFIDGRPGDITKDLDAGLIQRVSTNYGKNFSWKGKGTQPEEEREKMLKWLAITQEKDIKIRFWAMPENENLWKALGDIGIGWMNIDDLERYRVFYLVDSQP